MKVRNRYVAIVIAAWLPCLAVAVGFCLLALRPQILRAWELETKLEEAKKLYEVAQAAAKKEEQARMTEKVERLRSRVADFAIDLEAAPDLVFGIAQIASDAGVASFAMRPRTRQGLDSLPGCDRIGEKRIDLSFASPFHGFATFLNAMERHHPVLFIESFTISHSRLQSSQPQVNVELAVMVEKPQGG